MAEGTRDLCSLAGRQGEAHLRHDLLVEHAAMRLERDGNREVGQHALQLAAHPNGLFFCIF